MMIARLIFNILAVCGTGALSGVLLTIGLTLGAYWQSLPPGEFLDWFARNGQLVGRTVPFALVPAVVGVAGSLWLGWPSVSQRALWGAAAACLVILLVLTALINGPMNGQFAAKSVPLDQVPAMLTMWLTSHAARTGLAILAAILSAAAIMRRAGGL